MSAELKVAQQYFKLSNERDMDGIHNLLAESCTYNSDNTGTHHGCDNIIEMTKTFFTSFETLHWDIHSSEEIQSGVIMFDFTFTGTKKDGQAVERKGLESIIVVDGKIQNVEVRNK